MKTTKTGTILCLVTDRVHICILPISVKPFTPSATLLKEIFHIVVKFRLLTDSQHFQLYYRQTYLIEKCYNAVTTKYEYLNLLNPKHIT